MGKDNKKAIATHAAMAFFIYVKKYFLKIVYI